MVTVCERVDLAIHRSRFELLNNSWLAQQVSAPKLFSFAPQSCTNLLCLNPEMLPPSPMIRRSPDRCPKAPTQWATSSLECSVPEHLLAHGCACRGSRHFGRRETAHKMSRLTCPTSACGAYAIPLFCLRTFCLCARLRSAV